MSAQTASRIPDYRLDQMPRTEQGRALYERAEEAYPEPWRTEVMATVRRIEEEAARTEGSQR